MSCREIFVLLLVVLSLIVLSCFSLQLSKSSFDILIQLNIFEEGFQRGIHGGTSKTDFNLCYMVHPNASHLPYPDITMVYITESKSDKKKKCQEKFKIPTFKLLYHDKTHLKDAENSKTTHQDVSSG